MQEENKSLSAEQPREIASQEIVDKMKDQSLSFFNPAVWQGINLMAKTFHQSGALPKGLDSTPKVIMVLQAGREAGLQPLEAINSFYIVNGKVSLYGEMAIAQVLRAGHKIKWGKCDKTEASVTIIRGDNGSENTVKFTMQEAEERGLTMAFGKPKDVWMKFPDNMLRFKAFHACAKFIVPDALHGVQIKEVLEGEYEEEEPREKTKEKEHVKTEPVENRSSLDEALKEPEPEVEVMPEEEKPKSKRLKEDIIADVKKIAGEKNLDLRKSVEAYKKSRLEDLTVAQLTSIEEAAIKALVKPKEEKSEEVYTGEGWPEEVCVYLRYVSGIADDFLPDDIVQLKKDGEKGIFKGYNGYPSLEKEIKNMPKDFE